MAKDPAVLLYTQDFLTGTSLMTAEEVGCYIRLLCYQQQYGSLSEVALKKILNGSYEKVWPVIAEKFEQDENGFYNARMREEIARRQKFTGSRKKNLESKVKTPENNSHMDAHMGSHMESHMETATEIETKDLRKGAENHERGESHPLAGEITYDAEKTILESQIEFQRIYALARTTEEIARDSLHSYHLHLTEKEQYPRGRKSVFAGFEKWLRNEKKFTNGSHIKNAPAGSKQSGAYQLRDKARDNWLAGRRTEDS